MPFWDRSIDLIIMTHPDADHITGLAEVLDRYSVGGWLDNGLPDDSPLFRECQRLVLEKGIANQTLQRGHSLELEEGLVLDVLHPPPEPLSGTAADGNNNSLVLRLTWHGASFLLTGDIEAEAERLLLGLDLPLAAEVLKVAHHGSDGSSTADFLAAVDATYAVISVGADNRFGHPARAVVERLVQAGETTVLRTDEEGTIEVVTDGRQLWIETSR